MRSPIINKMPCYNPLTAYQSRIAHPSGKKKIIFKAENQSQLLNPIKLPCGQCIGCRLERSRQWAMRCENEQSLHLNNCFITLTYKDAPASLNKTDFPLFMKRLRKQHGKEIRFFHCGEYGELFSRAHHHAILFNHDFHDKYYWKTKNSFQLYRSPSLEALWPMGNSLIGAANWDTAAYVARYCTKKITGVRAESHYENRLPEHVTMSLKPGIGKKWLDKYLGDVYNYDHQILRNGQECKPAWYYDRLYDAINPEHLQELKNLRKEKAIQNPDNCYRRLKVKETITKIKLNSNKRTFEVLKGLSNHV
nr:MAG: replication initiator protein [Microviridae sp.]